MYLQIIQDKLENQHLSENADILSEPQGKENHHHNIVHKITLM